MAGYMSLDVVHKQNHGMRKFLLKNLLPGCTLVASLLHCFTALLLYDYGRAAIILLSRSKAVKHSLIM